MFFLQSAFLVHRVVKIDPEEVQADGKNDQYKYYFGKYRTEVCRKTFIETLDIKVSRLTSINKRKSATGDITPDKRGKRE